MKRNPLEFYNCEIRNYNNTGIVGSHSMELKKDFIIECTLLMHHDHSIVMNDSINNEENRNTTIKNNKWLYILILYVGNK